MKSLKLMLLTLFLLVLFPAACASADDIIYVQNNFKETVVHSSSKYDKSRMFYVEGIYGNKIRNVKVTSSNKSVATVKKSGTDLFKLMPKKAGSTKVTVTAVVNNKRVKVQGTFKVVDFQNPFTVLKVGGKGYASKVKSSNNYFTIRTSKSRIKLNYKLKSNWKLISSSAYGIDSLGSSGSAKVRNGSTYTLKKGENLMVYMSLKNKKNGVVITTWLDVRRR